MQIVSSGQAENAVMIRSRSRSGHRTRWSLPICAGNRYYCALCLWAGATVQHELLITVHRVCRVGALERRLVIPCPRTLWGAARLAKSVLPVNDQGNRAVLLRESGMAGRLIPSERCDFEPLNLRELVCANIETEEMIAAKKPGGGDVENVVSPKLPAAN
jgi:hypothetical protein